MQERQGGTTTIRHSSCSILISSGQTSDRCQQCQLFRSSLRSMLSKLNRAKEGLVKRTDPQSHTPYHCLTKEELTCRLRSLKAVHTCTVRHLHQIEQKLEMSISRCGVTVDEATHSDLLHIAKNHQAAVAAQHPPNSFARLFWEQQLKMTTCQDSCGRRWHPTMIKWALYLHHQSSSSYETLRSSGCIALPSQRTLRDYSHCIKAEVGFSNEVDEQLKMAPEVANVEDWQRHIILLLDEMHIRDELVYDKHTGALLGFANLGTINDHLAAYERSFHTEVCEESLATTMLVIMVRGLFTKLQYPYVQFAARNLMGHQIFDPFWEAVFRLERCGLKVVGVTFDGAKPNRSFIRLHRPAQQKPSEFYKMPNPYASDGREIFFFSDPPHLVKTARNCFQSKARLLWVNKIIHI